jgi:hypothetical protein
MRYLFIILTFPFLVAQAATLDCNEVKKIADELEKKIQKKKIAPDCEKLDAKSLGLPEGSIGFPKTVNDGWDYRCKDLSSLEMQLKTVENEIALLNGITNLKSEIKDGLTVVKSFKNPNVATEATTDLFNNLEIAQSLELFMATNNSKSENILSKIASDKSGWTDIQSFAELVKKYCAEFSKDGQNAGNSVCMPGYKLTDEVYSELNDFVILGKKTDRKFNKKQIADLTDALAIKKGDEKYSYSQLLSEVPRPATGSVLSAEDFKKIQEFPELTSNSKSHFLTETKKSILSLKGSESLVQAQNIPSRFSSYLNDLKKRQEWEMKSKLSLIFNQYSDLPEIEQSSCTSAKDLSGPVSECLESIVKNEKIPQPDKNIVEDIQRELEISEDHIKRLNGFITKCVPSSSLVYPSDCDALISTQMADMVAKSQYLNALKAKMLQDSTDLVILRNFTLEKLHSASCMQAGESKISDCYQEIGNISKEALTLSGDAKSIIYVFEKPKEDSDIEKICNETKEIIPFKADICKLNDEDPSQNEKSKNPDNFQASVDPETRNKSGEAFGEFTKSILQTTANFLAPRPPQLPNAYGPNYPMVPPMKPAMDISTQIMAPAIMSGYGSYQSTPGLPPYSSSRAGGSYSPYNFSTSSYFNYPSGL